MCRLIATLLIVTAAYGQSVNGALVDRVTRSPIPGAVVTLLGPVRYSATTDEIGAFHLPTVEPGNYVINIEKAGYLLPSTQPRLQVDADTSVAVEMDPLGRVEGRVRYPDGRPAPRATVNLSGGGRPYSAIADIGGNFRIEDVLPGSYVLRAAAAPGDPKAEGEIWAPTYFPSTVDRASAEPVPVNGLSVARDIRLRSVPARRLHGFVRDETGELAAGVTVRLDDQTVVTGKEGAFDFTTRDGEWRLTATRKDADLERRGNVTVTVSRHDLEDVQIRLALPFSVPVTVDGGGAETSPMVLLTRLDAPGMQPPVNVYPGRYTAHALGALPGSYLESIHLGDLEITGGPFDLWDGSQPIRVTFRQGAASIRGIVENADAAMVIVVAEAETGGGLWRMHSPANPRFEVGSLRPGDYRVFAIDHPTPGGLSDAVIQSLLPRAEKVHLEKGGSSTLTLKLIPVRP